ncbi:Predicted xylanase/chitin deacetylase [Paenibacillus uliginis N3/975]|uniref:Predicted xylanase/chitin deacetylase n=1 Tax=Paenibacillus uliginis N3/975 TaxID=1313296 RepID=A0A1X7GC56_9BACL|nr:polysaccharide deacetylase family protein [Paenibacillus uliginis]SMF67533.1 Predicted xylanase/chitin deacetylase [Paenibacillus uliginis N3/975]
MKPHGIMFHHFHDDYKHIRGQGSISTDTFELIISYLQKNYTILSADEWMDKALCKTLNDNEICLTFDDNLLCQYELAYPVLKKYNIKAFWFVYTSPFKGELEKVEIYRYFRSAYFQEINEFYDSFYNFIEKTEFNSEVKKALENFSPESYLSDFSFYTNEDRIFRFVRDQILKPRRYFIVMDSMLKDYNVELNLLREKLWMSKENIKELHIEGHRIGLHSHTHPTSVASLSFNDQMIEYKSNLEILSEILGEAPESMSHPCNSYNQNTIKVLEELKVKLGFRANMKNCSNAIYEFPREDHAIILKKMGMKV